ncbi:SHOCT domain-containing protein [Candidatus Bipolaricaulota bacterium]|nr:SHOCT domain-containing protein [Candidatus Bipolaricaulota bacterium]
MWHGYYGGGWLMIVGGILFWGSLIALIAWAIHRMTGRRDTDTYTSDRRTPMDVLKERYARGEITKQEFDDIRRDLMS